MIPRDEDQRPAPLAKDLGRAFLYARYNADPSREGLDAMGLNDYLTRSRWGNWIRAYIDALSRVGQRLAEKLRLEHFGPFGK